MKCRVTDRMDARYSFFRKQGRSVVRGSGWSPSYAAQSVFRAPV